MITPSTMPTTISMMFERLQHDREAMKQIANIVEHFGTSLNPPAM